MKKLFFYLFAIMAMVACSDDSSTEGGGNNGGNNGGGQTTQASLTVSPTNVDFSTDGGTSKVTITSSAAWTAEFVNDRADDWCSIDSTSGSAGTSTLTITATANDTPDDRTASVIVKSGTLSKTINVSQKQKDALTVTSSKFEVDAEGGEVVVEVKANIDFEYAIDDVAKEWISYEGTRAIQTSTLVFKVAKNDDTEKREGKITIKSGEFSEDVMIYQAGEEPSIVISQNEYTVSSDGETIAVEVSSNVDVAVEIPEDVDWIKESTTHATSTNTYYFDITKNKDYDQRSAEIRFTNTENNLSEEVKITQAQKDAIVVAKDSYTIDSEGDEIVIEVGHNIDFDVEISADWITRKETRAFNTDKLTFVIAENKDYDNREGTIVFKSKNDALSQIVKVYQAQKDALIISKKDIVVSAESGTISFELQTNVEFKVSEPNVDWLRAVTTRGLTTHTLHYEYDANTSYDSREAQIIVTDTKNNKSETITITQAQRDAIVLAKSEYEFASDGGNLDFEIQTNVDITVTISDNAKDWIQQVDTRALETKSLYFNIATYEAETDREGTITISGGNATQSIIVKQAGMKVEIIAFEDDLFKAYLVDYFDTNNDDEIDTREALSITTINCSGRSIYSLKGIEYLVNLKKLNCSNNSIVELDLTQNVNLTEIKCYSNSIVNLKLNGLTNLVYLDCNTNSLTSIDTSTNSALTYYSCASNPIKALNVSANTKLETLRCNSCSLLTSLNISNCGSLTALYINTYDSVSGSAITIDNSSLQSITLGGTAKWVTATITNNPYLKSIDFSNLRTLTSLTCTNNIQLSSLVTDKCYALKHIDCPSSKLTTIDISTNTALLTINCANNNLNSFDCSNNKSITSINCSNNDISYINCNSCDALIDLDCSNNNITDLNTESNTSLKTLKCNNNNITKIDFSCNKELKTVYWDNNAFTDIILGSVARNYYVGSSASNNIILSNSLSSSSLRVVSPIISEIDVSNNQLKDLDISECPALQVLKCQNNNIESIELLSNPILQCVYWYNNPLSNIVLDNTNRKFYYNASSYSSNLILNGILGNSKTLTITAPSIKIVEMNENQLEYIDLSRCVNLESFSCTNCTNLVDIKLPNCTEYIAEKALFGCSSLTNIILPQNIHTIKAYAFHNCSSLTEISIPESVTAIEELAFQWCDNLLNVYIPKSVTNIGNAAFKYCTGTLYYDSPYLLEGSSIEEEIDGFWHTTRSCSPVFQDANFTQIILGENTNPIGQYAFANMETLSSISIYNNIGGFAFIGCTNLDNIQLSNNITSIGDYAFSGCINLVNIEIPNNINDIGDYAFAYCDALTSILCEPVTPPLLGNFAFYKTTCNIYVPIASVDSYKIANGWKNYATKIFAKSTE